MPSTRNYLGQDINILNQTPSATETQKGIIEIASTLEALGLSDDTKALTPAKLAAAFGGANQGLTANGYQKLPGGLIIQWVISTATIAGATGLTFNLPIAFPTAILSYVATARNGAASGAGVFSAASTEPNKVSVYNNGTVAIQGAMVFAIGH